MDSKTTALLLLGAIFFLLVITIIYDAITRPGCNGPNYFTANGSWKVNMDQLLSIKKQE